MMERLLTLKKSVNMYYIQRANDKRKLTNREWSVTNEICSVLDPIAEVNIKI